MMLFPNMLSRPKVHKTVIKRREEKLGMSRKSQTYQIRFVAGTAHVGHKVQESSGVTNLTRS